MEHIIMKKILLILFLFLISLPVFASYNPNPTRILVSARYVHGATSNVLSAMTIGYVDFGTAYLTGSGPASYTAFNAPQNGTYRFVLGGGRCGAGGGTEEVIDTRGGSTIVYDQTKAFANTDCTAFMGDFIVPNISSYQIASIDMQVGFDCKDPKSLKAIKQVTIDNCLDNLGLQQSTDLYRDGSGMLSKIKFFQGYTKSLFKFRAALLKKPNF